MSQKTLFNTYPIFAVIQRQTEAIKKRVQSIPPNTILNASEHDLVQALVDEFRLNVPVIKDEAYHYVTHSDERHVDVYIPATETVIALPFDGDSEFFRMQPQTYSLSPPLGEITKNEIRLTYLRTDQNGQAIKQDYHRDLASIREYLCRLSQSVDQFNNQLEELVAAQLKTRKERLLGNAAMVAAINLPMKKREGMPVNYAVPIARRAPRIEQLPVSRAFKPEPAIAKEDYEEILRIMKNMVQVMELSPRAFHTMGEEDLRSHFLVQLNGAFTGQATAETFNFQGKTDILIRVDGKNVFIAECKIWRGEKGFLETIDQILSYLSWRDTKTSVLVFNRNADFSAVLAKIIETVPTHPNFKRDLGKSDETTFRYVFAQPNDACREVVVTILAFDIPTALHQPLPGK